MSGDKPIKSPTSMRLSDETLEIIDRLVEETGHNKTTVFEKGMKLAEAYHAKLIIDEKLRF